MAGQYLQACAISYLVIFYTVILFLIFPCIFKVQIIYEHTTI